MSGLCYRGGLGFIKGLKGGTVTRDLRVIVRGYLGALKVYRDSISYLGVM